MPWYMACEGDNMTFEEAFSILSDNIGDEFNWRFIPFTNKGFIQEAYREIQEGHPLYGKELWSVSKCDSNDDVLFVTADTSEKDLYIIIHLTYSNIDNIDYPKFISLGGLEEAVKYLEEQFFVEYSGGQ